MKERDRNTIILVLIAFILLALAFLLRQNPEIMDLILNSSITGDYKILEDYNDSLIADDGLDAATTLGIANLSGGAVARAGIELEKSKVFNTLIAVIVLLFLLTIIIRGRRVITLREEKPIDFAKLRKGMVRISEKVKELRIMDTMLALMQIRRVRLYIAIILILLTALILIKLDPTFKGFSVYQEPQISGGFAESRGTSVIKSILGLGIVCFVLMILVKVDNARTKIEIEKKDSEKGGKSADELLETKAKPKIKLKKQKAKPSKDFNKEKKTKVRSRKSLVPGIKPRDFEPEETMFSHKEEEFERKCTKAEIAMTKTNMVTADIKQQIVNTGLNDYLSKRVHENEHMHIPVKQENHKKRIVKVFRLSKKEDFYPIIECMRENEHLILIDAHGMLSKDPQLMKKLAKQLDYVGMAYDARLAALDERSFAIIPGFAQFEK